MMLLIPAEARGLPSPLRGGWRVAGKACLHGHAPGGGTHDTSEMVLTPTAVPSPQGGGERCSARGTS